MVPEIVSYDLISAIKHITEIDYDIMENNTDFCLIYETWFTVEKVSLLRDLVPPHCSIMTANR